MFPSLLLSVGYARSVVLFISTSALRSAINASWPSELEDRNTEEIGYLDNKADRIVQKVHQVQAKEEQDYLRV